MNGLPLTATSEVNGLLTSREKQNQFRVSSVGIPSAREMQRKEESPT